MLNLEALLRIKPSSKIKPACNSKGARQTKSISNLSDKSFITIIIDALALGAMTISQIIKETGISQSTAYKYTSRMSDEGLINQTPVEGTGGRGAAFFSLNGTDPATIPDIIHQSGVRVMQKNNKTGITGVHFNKETCRFFATFGRGSAYPFSNLLDAACKRKSLEAAAC